MEFSLFSSYRTYGKFFKGHFPDWSAYSHTSPVRNVDHAVPAPISILAAGDFFDSLEVQTRRLSAIPVVARRRVCPAFSHVELAVVF
jgi:hypothetical protein